MHKLPCVAILAALIPVCSGANLAYSTYLRDGFTPNAMTSDAQGNLYIAGHAVIDPVSRTASAAVAKLDPKASQYLYLEFLDSAASDQITAITTDGAGNLYVIGTTANTHFPATGTGSLAVPPTGQGDTRAFVTKLSPNGVVLFSVLIGGSVTATGAGIAVTPQGQILVSGISGIGFPATQGAYFIADTTNAWFLMELDPAASKVIFSATGIGGSSIALDPAGNIYLAGSNYGTNYPTTPGAYQTTFVQGHICYGLCQVGFSGALQHLTKVDPTGAKLFYSTGLNDPTGLAGSTVNTGLIVDAAGNAYVTGTLLEAQYPFTVTAPPNGANGFLTKVDPTGSSLVFSIPFGGAGVVRDSAGAVYTAGSVSTYDPFGFPGLSPVPTLALPDGLSWIPTACVPNGLTAMSASYLLKVDPATGKALDAQWIDGSTPSVTATTLAGSKLWAVGSTGSADVPLSPGALTSANLTVGPLPGTFLSAADFSQPPAPANGAPVIACVLDAGNMTHAGPVAAYQILSIFGANLGPSTGVQAPDGTDPSIAGVTVTFDGNPAKMLYASSSQINVMILPQPATNAAGPLPQSTVMQLSVNGTAIQRQLPFTTYNMNLFSDITLTGPYCGCPSFQPLALNMDGTRNSNSNPAKFGSLVSFFVDGVGAQQLGFPMPATVTGILAQAGQCPASVEKVTLSGIVYQVDVRLPSTLLPCATSYSLSSAVNTLPLTLTYNGAPVGPLAISSGTATPIAAQSINMPIWAAQ